MKISPNAQYVANAVDSRLVIRDHVKDLSILMVYQSAASTLDYIEWSPSSEYILAVDTSQSRIDVWSTLDSHWHAVFKDPRIETIQKVTWSSDSQHILYTADLNLFSGVWDLATGTLQWIEHLKYADKGIEVSPDENYVAIAEKRNGKDYLGIYHSNSFIFIQGFEVNTVDFQNFKWSPDSAYIAVWESCIYHKLLIYRQDGHLCTTYEGYKDNLGIKCVQWSPQGEMIAVGNYDGTIHLLSTLNWELIGVLNHPTTLTSNMDINVVEEIKLPALAIPTLASALVEYQYIGKRPYTLNTLRADTSTPYPKIGVSACQFSPDGLYLFSKNDLMPHVLWIWQVRTLQCSSTIVFTQPVRQAAWNPLEEHALLVICGNENIHFIQPTDNDAVEMIPLRVPINDFSVKRFKWNSNGESVVFMDGDLFCLAFL